jgi:AcrR family transcriptional regulator
VSALTETMLRHLHAANTARNLRSGRPLPPPSPAALRDIELAYPGVLTQDMRQLLRICGGLAETMLGDIDFTGGAFPEEPLPVFRPCLSLAIDELGRRWIAETSVSAGLLGPVWCVLSRLGVSLWISEDLTKFLLRLHESARHGETRDWLRGIEKEARWIWAHRRTLGIQFRALCRRDQALRGWVLGLPCDAYVYDLRLDSVARGVPYGGGRLYRCGRLPVFAVAAETATAEPTFEQP